MILLVTGGAGFIGSNFIRHRLEITDDKIIVLDSLTYAGVLDNVKAYLNESNLLIPKTQNDLLSVTKRMGKALSYSVPDGATELKRLESKLEEFNPNYVDSEDLHDMTKDILKKDRFVFVVASVIDFETDQTLMNLSDVVVHFAAESHVDRSIFDADAFIKTNVYGTYALLESAKKSKIEKFIHISTDEVYGHAIGKSFKEEDPLNPRNPYSSAKAAADRMAYAYHQTYGVPVVIARPSNNFGPNQYPEKLIPVMTIKAMKNEPLPVYGDGRQKRDWLYVEDTAKAIDLLIKKGTIGEAYNIAGNNERENISIVRRILEITHKPEGLIDHVKDRPGHDVRYSIDDSKIKDLGWVQDRDFDKQFEYTVNWYIQNQNWWEKILNKDEEYKEFMRVWYEKR